MIYFGIPLRSKSVSHNWEEVCEVFERTLRSAYHQTNPDFKIFVACHDLPTLRHTYDDRVEFLRADTPFPTDSYEMMLDKGWKISMIAAKIREAGGGYTMLLDSDDMVSNRIAQYCVDHPGTNGFVSLHGYIYNEGLSYVKRTFKLYRICGSCSIINYSVDDLPDHMPANFHDDLKDQYIIRRSHREIPNYMASIGRKLKTIPFITTVYVRNTGDNHSMLDGNDLSKARKLELFFRRKEKITEKMRREFGLVPLGK